jgi:FkbM family methyltransferase
MALQTRLQPTGKTISYLDSNPLWEKAFGEGGNGVWSRKYLKTAKQLCPYPKIVIDVGANIGQMSVYYADWAKEVWSFEPLPHLFEVAEQNIMQNSASNVKVFNFAVGEKECELFMKPISSNDGASFVTNKGGKNLVKVKSITLDSLLDDMNEWQKIDYIKIDVEGYEPFVIQGAKKLIEMHRPILQLEVVDSHLKRNNYDSVSLVKMIEELGYTAQLSNGKKIDSSKETGKDWRGDIFFLPKK